MLSARLQAIGGTRTSTSQDSQLCRLLTPLSKLRGSLTFASVGLTPTEHISLLSFPGCTGARYPAYRYPCPTLREQPCGCPRMARGQSGSLHLPCTTLSFATPCRFNPGANRLPHPYMT